MRNRELVLPTKGRAPGFEIGLDGPVLKLSATGSWTVRDAAGHPLLQASTQGEVVS